MASPGAPTGLAAPRGVGGTQPRDLGPVGRRSWWRAVGGRAGQEAWGGLWGCLCLVAAGAAALAGRPNRALLRALTQPRTPWQGLCGQIKAPSPVTESVTLSRRLTPDKLTAVRPEPAKATGMAPLHPPLRARATGAGTRDDFRRKALIL